MATRRKTITTRTGTTTTTTTGVSRRLAVVSLAALPLAYSQEKQGDKKKLLSVIGGTVFREPGFALPGALVELTEIAEGGKRRKAQKTVSDARGEFAYRLPGKEAKFVVKVSAKGFAPEEKEAATTPGVRTDVFFTLKPAAQ